FIGQHDPVVAGRQGQAVGGHELDFVLRIERVERQVQSLRISSRHFSLLASLRRFPWAASTLPYRVEMSIQVEYILAWNSVSFLSNTSFASRAILSVSSPHITRRVKQSPLRRIAV